MKQILMSTAVVLALAVPLRAAAADVKVLTTGAYKPVAQALVAEFEQRTGHKLDIVNDTAGAVSAKA